MTVEDSKITFVVAEKFKHVQYCQSDTGRESTSRPPPPPKLCGSSSVVNIFRF